MKMGKTCTPLPADSDDVDETDKSKNNDEIVDDVGNARMLVNSDIEVSTGQRKLSMPSLNTQINALMH